MSKELTRGWFEEYKFCGCVSEVVATKKELVGYCKFHGGDRRHIHRVHPRLIEPKGTTDAKRE